MKRRYQWLSVAAALIILFLLGPRSSVDITPPSITLSPDLDHYLQQSEARFRDITPGTEKTIRWAYPDKRKTPIALVYLHGYSATRQETAPLADDLATKLGANLFYTRLNGHGRPGQAMAEARAEDWLYDAAEALAIGKQLGQQVVIIGMSTGGTLAVWLASEVQDPQVLAYVLISPNFSPKDPAAQILNWPWASYFVPALLGPNHEWTPRNAEQARYWTHSHPTNALLPMMALVDTVNELPLGHIKTPLLMIYAPDDQVVSPAASAAAFPRWGAANKQQVLLEHSQDNSHHILAGRIVAPRDTPRVAALIEAFLLQLGVTPLAADHAADK